MNEIRTVTTSNEICSHCDENLNYVVEEQPHDMLAAPDGYDRYWYCPNCQRVFNWYDLSEE